jgi:ADP-ribose pyrophosphatase YjhB (NUDIX family)
VVIEREAVKAILLTPQAEVLLMRIRLPQREDCFWIPPGGGLEPGETLEAGLRRELREEVGLVDFVLGPLLWRRQHTFTWNEKRFFQREQYYAVHVSRFEPQMSDPQEAITLDQFRWWSMAELKQATERLTPLSLVRIITEYLAHGAPLQPLEPEILVD